MTFSRRLFDWRGEHIHLIVNAESCTADELSIACESMEHEDIERLLEQIRNCETAAFNSHVFISLKLNGHDLANDYIGGHFYKNVDDYMQDYGRDQIKQCINDARESAKIYNDTLLAGILADLDSFKFEHLHKVCDL